MADGFSIDIRGLKELDRKLRSLDKRVKRKLVRTAVKKGAGVIRDRAQSNAVSMVGGEMGSLIAKNLKVKVFRKQKRGSYGVAVRTKSNEVGFIWITQDGTREFIPAAIEFGHFGGWQQDSPTFVPAIPFVRTAFDSKVKASERTIARVLGLGLETGVGITTLNQ